MHDVVGLVTAVTGLLTAATGLVAGVCVLVRQLRKRRADDAALRERVEAAAADGVITEDEIADLLDGREDHR
ncbi:hypothetical protein [Actinokineospora sp. NBRC 105648]|uniref:hypothetical protein n=1 Tax=Actinokineospora sp. NBRC 105648 TaxID=3032206 RepID=UPI0024A577C0|nr:hypothetical protein [Actinokineospora sp. NBRC 105648]GLZ39847.1 hypothetical protein Acsp05_34710 [Actinokineospora sp. NBRC 105648]